MDTALTLAGPPASPDPQPDQAGPLMPERIAHVLTVLLILLDHAHTLLELLQQGTAMRGFTLIARCFGTTRLPVILASLRRGIRRAIALRNVLQACAAAGQDIRLPRLRTPRKHKPAWQDRAPSGDSEPDPPASGDPASDTPASDNALASEAARAARGEPRRKPPAEPFDPLYVPPMEVFQAEVLRDFPGRTIDKICRDLGVVPLLCHGPFWNALFEVMWHYGGDFDGYSRQRQQREADFARDMRGRPDLTWPKPGREAVKDTLGYFLGETYMPDPLPQSADGQTAVPEPPEPPDAAPDPAPADRRHGLLGIETTGRSGAAIAAGAPWPPRGPP